MSSPRSDHLGVGDRYEPLVLTVTKELNEQFVRAVDDRHSRYEHVVHPGLLLGYASITKSPSFFLPAGVQAVGAKMESEFLSAGSVGRTYTMDWLVTDVYEKRARIYQVTKLRVVEDTGLEILRRRFNTTFVGGEYIGRRARWEQGTNASSRSGNIPAQDREYEIVGRAKELSLEKMILYSGGPPGPSWPAKNIHTDVEVALEAGLERPIASGLMFEAYLAELMLGFFGESWLTGGKMSVTFIEPAGEGDILTPKATIQSREVCAEGLALDLELWCENQAGRRVVVGLGQGILRA